MQKTVLALLCVMIASGCGLSEAGNVASVSGAFQAEAAKKRQAATPNDEFSRFAKFFFDFADKDRNGKLTKQEYQVLFKDGIAEGERRKRTDAFWVRNDGNKNGTIELPELIRDIQRFMAEMDS